MLTTMPLIFSDNIYFINVCLLGYNTMCTCRQIPKFCRKIFRAEDGGIMFFQHLSFYIQFHMAMQPRRPT